MGTTLFGRSSLFLLLLLWSNTAKAQDERIPEALKAWKDWVLWDGSPKEIPRAYNDANTSLPIWPSSLSIQVQGNSATWTLSVQVFRKSAMQLPGDQDSWPRNVRASTKIPDASSADLGGNPSDKEKAPPTLIDIPLVVLPKDGVPVVELDPGTYSLTGEFQWANAAAKVSIPRTIGIVELKLDGNDVPFPNWDSSGFLWLSRSQTETAEQNRISVKVYRYLEDGIPTWLHTQVELSVSGKNREEDLGHLLPEGWTLAQLESSIPVAIDEQGRAKVQVRPGNWTVTLHAFRVSPLSEFRFAVGTTPAVDMELLGLKTAPEFRMIEFQGLQSIDVQQTTYPENWRNLPVFQWSVATPFTIVEKMRGMGDLKPAGLSITRQFWLDDDGHGLTYQDALGGRLQQSWRLDAAPDHELGAVRINNERQLITANPLDGTPGVEVRSRNPNIVALGRIEKATDIPATGWRADVDRLDMQISLPPGWRVWAILGADNVEGDWITAWTLMDLFLLLIFSLAIYRLYGIPAGLLALFAMGLSYHEPDSPRWTWLMLLIPLALLKVLPAGTGQKIVQTLKGLAIVVLLLSLVPFIAKQIEFAIYPQLEASQSRYGDRSTWFWAGRTYETTSYDNQLANAPADLYAPGSEWAANSAPLDEPIIQEAKPQQPQSQIAQPPPAFSKQASNLKIDPAARTQTGPARPDWQANTVHCYWDGPVSPEQRVQPIYLSRNVNRWLAVLRSLLLILLLAAVTSQRNLFGLLMEKLKGNTNSISPKLAVWLLAFSTLFTCSSATQAQFPDSDLLEQLRERLSKPASDLLQMADIADLDIKIQDNRITMQLEIHAAERVAVPLPGKFPAWAPRTVAWANSRNSNATDSYGPQVSRTEDGTLWVLVEPGVKRVVLEGLLPENNEWVLGFSLTPRTISIDAPQWQIVGLQGNKAPGNQLFFTRVEKGNEQAAKFDQRIFKPVVQVERRVELGLIWKVYTTVKRLSATGKAISLSVPLLNEERVVTSSIDTTNRQIEVNLEPDQSSYEWESELPVTDLLEWESKANDLYVERWILESSPVWNVEMTGISPVYETSNFNLLPVWQVWPGEKVSLNVKRPTAISGETLTVQKLIRSLELGSRQRVTRLDLDVESSLGGDFRIALSPDEEINELKINQRVQPARRDGNDLIISLEPGVQKIQLSLESKQVLGFKAQSASMTLPVKSANIETIIEIPNNRWILWAQGPLRGPAVRLWIFLASAIVLAGVLYLRGNSPLKAYEWLLLAIGLTQLHAIFGLIVIAWLYLLHWRQTHTMQTLNAWAFNLIQILIVALTVVALTILIGVVGKGLLGEPEMFIRGNGSYANHLVWFEPQSEPSLSQPFVLTISLWYYRLFMLLWALWLASALLRWLIAGWKSFSHGGRWHLGKKKPMNATIVETSSDPT
jgi:hypothetical protein